MERGRDEDHGRVVPKGRKMIARSLPRISGDEVKQLRCRRHVPPLMVSLLSDGWQKDAHVTPMKSLRAIDYLSRKFERKSAASGDALYFYDLCTILMHSTRYLGISTSMRIDCFSYPARRVRNTLTSNEILTIPRRRSRDEHQHEHLS